MIRKNVAGQYIYLCAVKASDGSALTGATISGYRSIDGAAQAAITGTITELANGQYKVALSQADTNGNDIGYLFTATLMIPIGITVITTAADPTNATTFGLGNLDAAISTRSTYAGADTAGTTTLLGRILGTLAAGTHNAQSGDAYARLGAPVGASISADIAGVAVSVWAVGTRTLTSFGTLIADIWAYATRTLSAFAFSVTASSVTDKTGYSLSVAPPTAATIATTVVDQTLSGHTTAGTVGGALNSASSAGDPWNTALPGAYASGTAGNIIGNRVDAAVSSRSSHAAADIWAVGTRTLTSFGTLVADVTTAVWGAATRTLTAFGFTVATNSDTNVTAIKAKTDNLPASPAATSDIPTANANADALLDRADAIETGWTLRKALRIISAACAGKLSGAATATATIRNLTDTKARITATTDADGNRTSVTLDGA